MDFTNWMTAVKDEVHINKLVIPAAHNAGTKGVAKPGCCQDGTLYEQYRYGIREFGLFYRLKKGVLRLTHGLSTGAPLEEALKSLSEAVHADNTEFMIIDLRRYGDQKIGPFTFRYGDDRETANALVEKYLEPEKYAYTDFEKIADITMGDIRKSGKKYLLHSPEKLYTGSRDFRIYDMWDKQVFGYKIDKFVKHCTDFLDTETCEDFLWFQTQQTPNPGTENGFKKWPRELDEEMRPHFREVIKRIGDNPKYLEKVNIIGGDFMTRDYMKVSEILSLNLLKGFIKDECVEDYKKMIDYEVKQ
ncbi:MAG: hypothetical protein II702_03340 [Clostridia bacterium]|nr:hypothetical protein [Clostridia bacterium]